MKNIDIIKNSIKDSALKGMFSMKIKSNKITATIKKYESLFDESTRNMQEDVIDTFLAATFLLKAIIIKNPMLDREETCELAVDMCIGMCRTPLIIEKGEVHTLQEADYSEKKLERDTLIEVLLNEKKEDILNSDISNYLRNMYMEAPKIGGINITSASHQQKIKSIFPIE